MKKGKTLKTIADLAGEGLVRPADIPALQEVVAEFNVAIPPTIVELLQNSSKDGPIHKQFVPQTAELDHADNERGDPVGDHVHEKVKGLVHRYPDRCLLKVVNVCPVYCRFCFRKEMIGAGSDSLSPQDLTAAYDYIKLHPEIWEVILTGGDPFILKPKHLGKIIAALADIKHVEVIRIHTRIPMVDPLKVTQELVSALKINKAVYVVIHANHPDEFTDEAILSCNRLSDAGIPLLSQSVLLKGINDQPEILKALFKALVRNKIKPYQLHHPDLVKGTSHFRLPIEKGQDLMRQLNGHISGLCQPTYVLDIPGGKGKVPLSPSYGVKEEKNWRFENYLGEACVYEIEEGI